MVRAASRAPVFGAFDDQLGHGIVGGNLIQVERVGNEIAKAAQALLSKAHAPGEVTVVPLSKPRYDWRELKKWNIDFGLLPQDSEVLFKPPGFWEKYAVWILGVVIVVVAQGVLLITLLIQRQKRRKAEQAHASLGRRLITANEDERRLLARELHDDLSQRLARVAIDAGFARSRRETEEADEALMKLHAELVSISKDVHDMSYRLHPSLVDDLGIVAALQSEIERIQRQVEVRITGQIIDVPRPLSPEMALCVFRIAQEALQNAVKHAQASEIEIALEPSGQGLLLTVRDDGVGFDLAEVTDRFSLGLSSMRERAALVGGDLTINSRPGSGTTVTLTVPIDGMNE
jgi:signal transduction histidine kinase